MTGGLPKLTIQHDRGGNLLIACFVVDLSPVVQQSVFQNHSLRQEEREARSLFSHHEDTQLFTDLSMVSLLCLLDAGKILFEVCFLGKCSTVDTGQHLVFLVSSPVSTCQAGEFEGLHGLGVHEVRSCTEVHKLALTIKAQLCIFRKILNQLYLVGFFFFLHEFDGLFAGHCETLQRKGFFDDLLHLSLDLLQILAGKRSFSVYIVVETVFDGRSDGQFGLRIQTFDGLSHDMGSSVAECSFSSLAVKSQNVQLAVRIHNGTKIYLLAVDLAGTGNPGQALADVHSDVINAFCFCVLFFRAVFQCDDHNFPPYKIKSPL